MKGYRSPSLVGQKFGKWTVLERIGYIGKGTQYLCRCECGRENRVSRGNLVLGRSRSCGHHRQSANRTHGLSHTGVYQSWINKRSSGGVAGRWKKVEEYASDAQKHPGKRAIRIDLSKPFSPENCRWMTPNEASKYVHTIQDEFSSLQGKVSRQRIYQLRKKRDGLCVRCGRRETGGRVLCKVCLEKLRERYREVQK